MKKKKTSNIKILDSDPSVNLIALHSGEVVYQSKVGDGTLALLISELSKLSDFPIEKQEYQIDNIGQEIFQTADKEFLFSLRGSFTSLSWHAAKQLSTVFLSEGLTFAFVVSY